MEQDKSKINYDKLKKSNSFIHTPEEHELLHNYFVSGTGFGFWDAEMSKNESWGVPAMAQQVWSCLNCGTGCSCSSDLVPGLGTSLWPLKKKKKKELSNGGDKRDKVVNN